MKQILVKPVSANLTRNTEMFSKMDPYCLCILGEQQDRTKTKNEAGSTPAWGEVLVFNQPHQDISMMTVQVWDADPTTDDLVGEGHFDTTLMFLSNGKTFLENVNLYYKGKPAGEVFVEIETRTVHNEGTGHFFPGVHNKLNEQAESVLHQHQTS